MLLKVLGDASYRMVRSSVKRGIVNVYVYKTACCSLRLGKRDDANEGCIGPLAPPP